MQTRRILLALVALVLVGAAVAAWWLSRTPPAAQPPVETANLARTAEGDADTGRRPLADGAAAGEAPVEVRDTAKVAQPTSFEVDGFLDDGPLTEPGPEREPAAAHGTIVDELGQPVVGARVLLSTAASFPGLHLAAPAQAGLCREDTSDEAGRFALRGLDAGHGRAAVRASGFAPLDVESLWFERDGDVDLGMLRLTRGVVLAGRIVDSTGAPASDVAIHRIDAPLQGPIEQLGPETAELLGGSDELGRFELAAVAPGAWRLLLERADTPQKLVEGVADARETRVDGLEFVLSASESVQGSVIGYRADFGPLRVVAVPTQVLALIAESRPEGADLDWARDVHAADVDAGGRFEVAGLEPGAFYSLHAEGPAPGIAERRRAEVSSPRDLHEDLWSKRVDVIAGDRDVEIDYLPSAELEFDAVNAFTGAPVERLRASIETLASIPSREDLERQRTHFPGGRVLLEQIRPQRAVLADLPFESEAGGAVQCSLRVEAPGFDVLELEDVELSPGQRTRLGMLRLTPLPILEVIVLDARDSAPIGGARVELVANTATPPRGRDRSVTRSDARGSARLTSLATPNARLLVSAEGFAPASLVAPPVADGERPAVVVRLEPGARVTVSVVREGGQPCTDAAVWLLRHEMPDGASWAQGRSVDAQGRARFEDVPAGVFSASAERTTLLSKPNALSPWRQAPSRSVVVAAGEDVSIELRAEDLSGLYGAVWIGREPLADATLSLAAGRMGFHELGTDLEQFSRAPRVRTGLDGRFDLGPLPAGEYTLLIEHAGRGVRTRRLVRVEPTPREITIDIDDTAIIGRVVDSTGRAVEGATLRLFVDRPGRREDLRPGFGEAIVPESGYGAAICEAVSGTGGAFRIRAVPPDVPLQLMASVGGRAVMRPRLRTAQGATTDVQALAIPDAGALRLVLRAPTSEPGTHYGARVVALRLPEGLGLRGGRFDEAGTLELGDLAAGSYRLIIAVLDSADRIVALRDPETVEVAPGVETELFVEL